MWDLPIGDDGPLTTVLQRLHVEDRGRIEDALLRAIHDGSPLAGQGRLLTDHGERTFAFLGYSHPGPDGGLASYSGYSVDVTDEANISTRSAVDGAVAHRAAIEQVKGALMVTGGLTPQEAFALLRERSNAHNVKLAVLAEAVVTALADGVPRRDHDAIIELVGVCAASIRGARPHGPTR